MSECPHSPHVFAGIVIWTYLGIYSLNRTQDPGHRTRDPKLKKM